MNIAGSAYRSIPRGGFFDRHPILVPATLFFVCWIPYLVVFFRRTIAFGNLGEPADAGTAAYWALFLVQLGVCVISHSLTIRTIVRLYAPLWLIWGSIAFYSLSPAWGLITAADIRHPLFAAVFCVFTSSCVFALYSKSTPKWLWVQLAGGALSVCLLRAQGIWIILPTLLAVLAFKIWRWRGLDTSSPMSRRIAEHFQHLGTMAGNKSKKEESYWADVCAAFLVLSAVSLLFLLTYCIGWSLPLGEPSFSDTATDALFAIPVDAAAGMNLTGTLDVAGILSFATIANNSVFPQLAERAARFIFQLQCLPVENITFSWVAFLILFAGFSLFALRVAWGRVTSKESTDDSSGHRAIREHDIRPLIIGLSMVVIIGFMAFTPGDATLRYLMPVLAAQPMFFGACFASWRSMSMS